LNIKTHTLTLYFLAVTVLCFVIGESYAQNSAVNETRHLADPPHIDLSKMESSNMIISNGTSFVGSFGTTYTITGTASDIKGSIDVLVSSIIDDFTNSSTIGYVKLSDSESTSSETQIANPFASKEQINQKIQVVLSKSIKDGSNKGLVEINCLFGNSLDLFSCSASVISD
jgi:hypothetical protein